MNVSQIQIEVHTNEENMPEKIVWNASSRANTKPQDAKAMIVSFWDGTDKTSLRIDLWTKQMMVDEMADFFYQTFVTMADTYSKATQYTDQAKDIKEFAVGFLKKFKEKQLAENKAE